MTEKLGSKYERSMVDMGSKHTITGDVYTVLEAFDVHCPALQHAIKKLLCAGIRGHKTMVADIEEAKYSLVRALEMQEGRGQTEKEGKPFDSYFASPSVPSVPSKHYASPPPAPSDTSESD